MYVSIIFLFIVFVKLKSIFFLYFLNTYRSIVYIKLFYLFKSIYILLSIILLYLLKIHKSIINIYFYVYNFSTKSGQTKKHLI
jgi:hypothetical protein